MVSKYAVIDNSLTPNVVVNLILWDPDRAYNPGEDRILVPADDLNIGDVYPKPV